MFKNGKSYIPAVSFLILALIVTSLLWFPDFANSVSPSDICVKHNVSAGEFTSCYYCHNAESQEEPGFTINTDSGFCLSCHDGSTKDSSMHSTLGSIAERTTRPVIIGQTTGIDHPFSVSYSDARNMSRTLKLKTAPVAPVKLFNDKVECASCHDPHSCENPLFLRIKNDRSVLCLTCHDM